MAALYAFSYIQRIGIPGTIFDELQADFRITAQQVTTLSGIYLFIYAFMQVITGGLVDRFGPAKVIFGGGMFLSVGSIIFPLSHSIESLYISRGLVGLGGSLMYLSIVKELDIRFSSKSFSVWLSVMILAGYCGGLLATRPFEIAVSSFGWRKSLLYVGIFCGITTVCSGWLFRKTKHDNETRNHSEVLFALKSILINPKMFRVTYTCAIAFLTFFIMQGVIGKKMLEDCCGLLSSTAASVIFLMMFISMIASVITGVVSAMLGNRRRPFMITAAVSCLLGIVSGLQIINGNASYVIPFAVFMGIGSSGAPVFAASVKELNHPDFAATSVGVMNGFVYIAIAVLSVFIGRILDMFGGTRISDEIIRYPAKAYRMIMIICLVLTVVSVFTALFSKETKGTNIYYQN